MQLPTAEGAGATRTLVRAINQRTNHPFLLLLQEQVVVVLVLLLLLALEGTAVTSDEARCRLLLAAGQLTGRDAC